MTIATEADVIGKGGKKEQQRVDVGGEARWVQPGGDRVAKNVMCEGQGFRGKMKEGTEKNNHR